MTHARLAAGLWLAATLWPAGAAAQLAAPREAANLEIGAISLYPSVKLLEAGRDTNVFNDEANPREDETFTLNARLLAVVRTGAGELLLASGSEYLWFRRYAEERSGNAQYSARMNFGLQRLKPYVGADYQRTRARTNAEIDARARRRERTGTAGAAYELSERTAITGAMQVTEFSYDQGETFRGVDLSRHLNRQSREYHAGVRYALTPLTTLAVTADYGTDRFQQTRLRDGRRYGASATVSFSPEAILHGSFTAGVESFQPDQNALSRYRGAVFDGDVEWVVFARTLIGVQASRRVSFSYREEEPYFLSTGVRVRGEQQIFGRVSLLGGVGRETLSYRWQLAGNANRQDVVRSVTGGVAVDLGSSIGVAFTAERLARNAVRGAREDYRRVRLLGALTIGS